MLNPKKVYFVDHALAKIVGFRSSEDRGRLLENEVFVELKRRGYNIYYHKENKECDFVIREGIHIVQAIQVCAEMDSFQTRQREIEGLVDAMKTYQLKEGLILTADHSENIEFPNEQMRIDVVPIWKWMLQRKKQ